ncbi:TonB-dependent receptor [Polaribacter vadi]|uniref:SusC/RagA family TonB-linked outer membrane protein n=1 Tax=Polaribacter TaxID=52959 RepID=UPI001C0A027C|nr:MULTISPECIES: TonB-dependent receptor [Polaribacter]MBU3012257.1 TonB-dependent receptor [Polaribacter vadi]MDO6742074.1 TonB-dependent receptor [Polaribacter sp. 1_MG-2023]
MKKHQLLLLFLIISSFGFSQQRISGRVTDNANEPIPGVSVTVLGTLTGVITDFDGKYEINAEATQELKFSYLGFVTQTILIGNRDIINITLQEDLQSLDEVVIVGFGKQKKINLSGAVNSVSVAQLSTRPVSNITQGMQGVSPGLNIDFTNGAPGSNPKINVRGFTSINGGEPLILIDNIPSDVSYLNQIAPEDIENISVLKDAASSAIYGSRAAFGVVLVTTRNGSKGKTKITYNNYMSVGTPTVLPQKTSDPYIYMRLQKTFSGNTPWDNQFFTDDQWQWAKERSNNPNETVGVRANSTTGMWEYMGNKDWSEYFLSNTTFSSNHNFSISGGNEKLNYFVSASTNKDNGALQLAEDYFTRTGLRAKLNTSINDWLSFGNNTSFIMGTRKNPSYFDITSIYNFNTYEYNENPDGTWANTGVGRMAAQLVDGGDEKDVTSTFRTNFTAQAWLVKDVFKINAEFTYEQENQNYDANYTKYKIGFAENDIREEGVNQVWKGFGERKYSVLNVFGTFTKTINDNHDITLLGGYNQEDLRNEYTYLNRDGVISASLPTIQLATGNIEASQSIYSWAVRGLFYRANYIYKNRYILELNGRYDGSSKFPKDKRFGFFPSVSAAWNISKESFMDKVSPTLSLLKFRGSYGTLGNQDVNPFDYIPFMSATNGGYIVNGELPLMINSPSLVSDNYTWEKVTTRNFGVDLGFLNNQIKATFDIYRRDTKDMLTLGKELPGVIGANEPLENAANLKTNGWELSIAYQNSFGSEKPLGVSARFILSDSRSYITSFDNPNNSLTQFREGMELGEIWGLTSDGLFESQDEIDALDQTSLIPWGALTIVEGWPKYKDLDGNGVIELGTSADDPKDASVIGNMMPRFRLGFNLNLDWNNFDLGLFLQGVGKRDYYPKDYLYWGFYQQPYAGGYAHLNDYYRATDDSPELMAQHSQAYIDAGLAHANTDANYPVAQAWLADRNLGERIDQAKGLAIPQSKYLLSGAYLRLKNITFGYTLPNTFTNRIGISSLRIYFSGDNLFEWSEVADFFDPESISDIDNRLNPGYSPGRTETSGYQYPYQRKYALGINVSF